MGHFGEIRLADPVFSAVVLPNATDYSWTSQTHASENGCTKKHCL